MADLDTLELVLARLVAGTLTSTDVQTLHRSLQTGQIALATGERAVASGGDMRDAIIVTCNSNVVSVFRGSDAATIQQVVQRALREITNDRFNRSLQDYFCALRAHCTSFPYLALEDLLGSKRKTLDKVYVPLRAREKSELDDPSRDGSNIADVLRETMTGTSPRHVLIVGEPGAGKSTLLRQIAQNAWDAPSVVGLDQPYLTMVVRLQSLALVEGASLETRLVNALHMAGELALQEDPPKGFLAEWARRLDTHWLLLLDGLDEAPAHKRSALLQWLNDLLTNAKTPIRRIVVTSRPTLKLVHEVGEQFAVYDLLAFTQEQQTRFAHNWFNGRARDFLQELEQVKAGTLSNTPLLLTIAAAVYSHDGHLPERRFDLYDRFVEVWLAEAELRGLKAELGERQIKIARSALEHLALAMTDEPKATSASALYRVVADYLQQTFGLSNDEAISDGEKFIEVMGRRSGIFVERSQNYEWFHPTFREHLALCRLNRRLESQDFTTVLGKQPYWIWDRRLNLIVDLAQISNHRAELVRWLGTQVINEQEDTAVRWRVAEVLRNIGDARANESLTTAALTDADWQVRKYALRALSRIGAAPVIDTFVMAALADSHNRQYALTILEEVGQPALERLSAVLLLDFCTLKTEPLSWENGPLSSAHSRSEATPEYAALLQPECSHIRSRG